MPSFRAVLFDLDGTLIGIDVDSFLAAYVERLSGWLADRIDPAGFRRCLLEATGVMLRNRDPGRSNEAAFWEAFERLSSVPRSELDEPVREFYLREFPKLRALATPVDGAVEAVRAAFAHAEHVVIATNPIFPEEAIRERMRWAGVADFPFALVTSYERMHACKPDTAYYDEILARIGVRPEEALMVGNDPEADLAAGRLGVRTFLVESGLPHGGGTAAAAALADEDGSPQQPAAPRPDYRGTLRDLARLLALSAQRG